MSNTVPHLQPTGPLSVLFVLSPTGILLLCCQRTYDAALRAHNHPDAGSKTGDNLTEAAYAAGHRVQETVHKLGDKVSSALGTDKPGAPVTTSETNQK